MRIALHAGSLRKEYYDTFLKVASQNPDHEFLFLFDKETTGFIGSQNTSVVVITPPPTIPLKWRIWYHLKLPSVLKKFKADIFISEKLISLKLKIPQILISPDISFIHPSSETDKKQSSFYKKTTPALLKKSQGIIVSSFFEKKEIVENFKVNEEKIKVIYPEIGKKIEALSSEEREKIKEKIADGNEYFIYKGTIGNEQNLLNLLKAFSFFKKRQRSKMQLIFLGNPGLKYAEFVASLRLYRFNKDVKVMANTHPKEAQKILAAAYSMICIPDHFNEGNEVIEAMNNEISLIVSNFGILEEYCGKAALYADPKNINDIADKMMLLFKDEQKRKDIIEAAKLQIAKFTESNSAIHLFELITHTVTKNLQL